MRLLIAGMLTLLLTGCYEPTGRYQIASSGNPLSVWRVDTRTGEVSVCFPPGASPQGKVTCHTSR